MEKRYERKYITETLDAPEVEVMIMLHPASFGEKYPSRFINNIYFDTPDFEDYQSAIQGIPDRKKVRVRWYGDPEEPLKEPQLELKYKNGTVVSKEKFSLIPFEKTDVISPNNWRHILERSNVPSSVIVEVQDRSPVVLNSYFRKYYMTPDRRFRITIDSKMKSRMIGWFNKNSRSLPSDNVVIELKYELDADLDIGRISQFLPFTLSKNSKYLEAARHI